MPDIHHNSTSGAAEIVMCKGKDHEDKSKWIYSLQSQSECAEITGNRKREHAKRIKGRGGEGIGARQRQRN